MTQWLLEISGVWGFYQSRRNAAGWFRRAIVMSDDDLERGSTFRPKYDAQGLIGAIVTDAEAGEVLMFAWMNAAALAASLDSGIAHFWSRSRQKLWRKGEESGNELEIVEMRTDCDQDALVVRVRVRGAGLACHTGARSCFYRRVIRPTPGGAVVLQRTGG
jgi:phosphoribosyl-AMP cyclohydrolase